MLRGAPGKRRRGPRVVRRGAGTETDGLPQRGARVPPPDLPGRGPGRRRRGPSGGDVRRACGAPVHPGTLAGPVRGRRPALRRTRRRMRARADGVLSGTEPPGAPGAARAREFQKSTRRRTPSSGGGARARLESAKLLVSERNTCFFRVSRGRPGSTPGAPPRAPRRPRRRWQLAHALSAPVALGPRAGPRALGPRRGRRWPRAQCARAREAQNCWGARKFERFRHFWCFRRVQRFWSVGSI